MCKLIDINSAEHVKFSNESDKLWKSHVLINSFHLFQWLNESLSMSTIMGYDVRDNYMGFSFLKS